MLLGNIGWFLTSSIVTFVTEYFVIYPNATRQHRLVSDFSYSERDYPTKSMQKTLSTYIKSLDLLFQEITTF